MKSLVAKSPIGFFVFSEKGELLNYELFGKNVKICIERFTNSENNLENQNLVENDLAYKFLRKNIRKYANDFGFSDKEFNLFMSEFCFLFSKKNMKIERDKFLIQATKSLDDMNKILSLCYERVEEWFGLHYPELNSSKLDLVEKIIKYGNRQNLQKIKRFSESSKSQNLSEDFPNFENSVGVQLSKYDEQAIKEFCLMIKEINDKKIKIENYIEKSIKEIMPNFSSIVEPILSANLLSLAGSIKKLSRMPASSIQLLGSEKALFRHLKKKGKAPKYGILFIDKRIQDAPDNKKGKIARLISSKLMIACRIDAYSKRDCSEKLKKELEKEVSSIYDKN